MQSIHELVKLMPEQSSIDDVRGLNELVKETKLQGRPIAAYGERIIELPFFAQGEDGAHKLRETPKTFDGFLLGEFCGFLLIEEVELHEDYTSTQDIPHILTRDTADQTTIYAAPLGNNGLRLSDVLIDLYDHDVAQSIEDLLAQDMIDLFELSRLYRTLPKCGAFERAQFSAHAQFLFNPSDVCSSVTADCVKSYEGDTFVQGLTVTAVDRSMLAFVTEYYKQPTLTFVGHDTLGESDMHTYIYLDKDLSGYTLPPKRTQNNPVL